MADSINPRLFARVERSLSRRLHTDASAHLQRCATRARGEDEFLAAAARLLINPQERLEWLASWAKRREADRSDTSPSELEPSVPMPLDLELPQEGVQLSDAHRDRLREALAHELGPVGDLLLEQELQQATSTADLLERLASRLENEHQRARFRQHTESSPKFHSGA